MINRLINIEIPEVEIEPAAKIMPRGVYTVAEYAKAFIDGMGDTQKSRFKKMLENNIKCGQSVADNYGINYDEFIEEVKKQMEV